MIRSLSLLALLALSLSLGAPRTLASGIPVVDVANLAQNVTTAIQIVNQTLQQIEQYKTQLDQYELQVRNSNGPEAYIWSEVATTLGTLQENLSIFEQYNRELGQLEDFLALFQDLEHYRKSPCAAGLRCNDRDRAALEAQRSRGLEARMKAGNALIRGVAQQQESLLSELGTLQSLQIQSEQAEGQMEALAYSNQFASMQTEQLMQIRAMFLAQQNLQGIEARIRADREAQETARLEYLTRGLADYKATEGKGW